MSLTLFQVKGKEKLSDFNFAIRNDIIVMANSWTSRVHTIWTRADNDSKNQPYRTLVVASRHTPRNAHCSCF